MLLKYKTVMMTGGASGIGRATVLMLAKEGARVILCDVNEAGANETIKAAEGGLVEFLKVELTDGASVDACAKQAIERSGGKIDAFVNAAGWDRTQPFVEADQAFLDKVLGINLLGPLRLTRALFPAMIANGGGKIVFVASRRRPRRQPRRDALLGGQGRHHRLHQVARTRGRAPQDHRQLRVPRPDRYAAVCRQPRAHARGPAEGDPLPAAGQARGHRGRDPVFRRTDERLRDGADPLGQRGADDGGVIESMHRPSRAAMFRADETIRTPAP